MSFTYCRNPWAARTWQPLPLMPPPADLENAAPLLPKITQSQNRSNATSKKMHGGEQAGKGVAIPSSATSDGVKMHNVTECVLLCACSVKGEDRGSEGVDEMIT